MKTALWLIVAGVVVYILTSSRQAVAQTPLGTLLPLGGAGGGTATGPAGTTVSAMPVPPQPGAGVVRVDVVPAVLVGPGGPISSGPAGVVAVPPVVSGPPGTVVADPQDPNQPQDPVLQRCIVASADGLNQFPLPAECGRYGFFTQ